MEFCSRRAATNSRHDLAGHRNSRGGEYRVWVRYADFANKSEVFVVRVSQSGREVFGSPNLPIATS